MELLHGKLVVLTFIKSLPAQGDVATLQKTSTKNPKRWGLL